MIQIKADLYKNLTLYDRYQSYENNYDGISIKLWSLLKHFQIAVRTDLRQ